MIYPKNSTILDCDRQPEAVLARDGRWSVTVLGSSLENLIRAEFPAFDKKRPR